jgi:hypothetical protein
MKTGLAAKENRFDTLVETIVVSPQFRNARVPAPHETTEAETRR